MFLEIAYVAAGSLAVSPFLPDKKMSHKKKLNIIFRRTGFMRELRDLYGNLKPKPPRFNGVNKTDRYTDYIYSIPLGLTLSENLDKSIIEAFDQPVKVTSVGGRLHIRFYPEDLPEKIPYVEVPKKSGWRIPVGASLDGWIYHNFEKIPHMTVAGTTRFGKTVFLKTTLTYLTENQSEDVRFHIIDMKGGLEFGPYEKMKQVVKVGSDVGEAAELLENIKKDIERKMRYFKRKGYNNIVNTPIKTRNFIIVDEAAQLTPDKHTDPEVKKIMGKCQSNLSEIARVSGALGYRLIFCTQYPTGDTLPRQVKQNADGKISFRLPTGTASRVAIDENGAEYLPNPGRAIYRTHERDIVQVPMLEDDEMKRRLKPFITEEKAVVESGRSSNKNVSGAEGDNIMEFGYD
ncbi:FtsK/SpoIIIE domain-containing protein [Terrihalobacillus insolitus]|uniref:FtsK/SpoIIIE domain-containing protein n=1 Tax=Terrihalobacillus insolitus TaxID=2950438 RepID=UPI002340EA9D|nr:FtsK/SpoIIIE domain-containing protein [Terrihalobacillus insolitus]MDC3412502.1 FtsK/SpoIIIE domain-containing protein [Terrihalobacillus insolitus]